MPGKVYAATEAFSTDVLGHPRTVSEGETFRAGHKIVESHPGAFREFTVDNEVEEATAEPGRKRTTPPAKKEK